MATVCPTVLAADEKSYAGEMAKVAHFAHRLQIDLTDGVFAARPTVKPEAAWWPAGVQADFHLMYKYPANAAKLILKHQPNMIIIHAEAEGDFKPFAEACHKQKVKVGVALLPLTKPELIAGSLDLIDHVMIFSGDLGSYGGVADLSLLDKVKSLKSHKPNLEIGWDGGVNDQNVAALVTGGVDVLNVGAYIQKADSAQQAYEVLQRIADETGTT